MFLIAKLISQDKEKIIIIILVIIRFDNIKSFWRRIRRIEFFFTIFNYKVKRN